MAQGKAEESFLDGLEEPDRRELASASADRLVPTGALVFDEGDEADGLYVVGEGAVSVYRRDESGADTELAMHGAGEIFGELALLEGGRRSASVRAATDVRLTVVEREAFLNLVARRPAVALRILAALSQRVRERSERMLREEAARREVELQAEVDRHRTLTQMVAGIAHELNTPLGTANTAADIVAKRLATDDVGRAVADDQTARNAVEDAREAAELLLRNIARAHHLVTTFKQVSVQQSTAAVETVDFGRLVADTVDLFRIDARGAGLTVTVSDGRQDPTQPWTGHAAHVTQVLLNLLGNVARYAYREPGGVAEVSIRDAELGNDPAIELAVADHGVGIPPEDLSRVFEPFFTTGRSKGGSGLGLSIVRTLVRDALGGTIEVASTPGTGTRFTVVLPRSVSGQAPDASQPAREEVLMA